MKNIIARKTQRKSNEVKKILSSRLERLERLTTPQYNTDKFSKEYKDQVQLCKRQFNKLIKLLTQLREDEEAAVSSTPRSPRRRRSTSSTLRTSGRRRSISRTSGTMSRRRSTVPESTAKNTIKESESFEQNGVYHITGNLNVINISAELKSGCDDFRPLCPVKINGVPAYALLDSGNTVSPAVSKIFAKKLFPKGTLKENLQPVKQVIGSANKDAPLRVLGITKKKLNIKLGGHPHEVKTRVIVIDKLNSNVNLSGPFMTKYGMDQLHSQGCLKFDGKKIKLVKFTRAITAVTNLGKEDKGSFPHKNPQKIGRAHV